VSTVRAWLTLYENGAVYTPPPRTYPAGRVHEVQAPTRSSAGSSAAPARSYRSCAYAASYAAT
jgi:hypothetical protein